MCIRLIIVRRLGTFGENEMSFFTLLFQDGGINSTDPDKRIAAIDTLAANGGADAATRIGAALNDHDSNVARKAADALACLRTPSAQDALSQALNKALAERAGPPNPKEHEFSQGYWLDHLADSLAAFGPSAAPQLIAILQNRETELHNRPYVGSAAGAALAAEHLGKMFYAGAANALIDRLKDPISSVRWSAASALGAVRAATAVEPLISALRDQDEMVRRDACEALGKIGDVRAVAALEAKLKDGSDFVRARAIAALERLGWKPQGQDQQASVLATKGEYAEAAKLGGSAIRPLMAAIWNAYDINNMQSNDAQGMANQLKNLMNQRELGRLPRMHHIQEVSNGLLIAMKGEHKNFELKDLKMLAVMPDLRVHNHGPRTYDSENRTLNENNTYEVWEDYIEVVSCDELRKEATELIAAIGKT